MLRQVLFGLLLLFVSYYLMYSKIHKTPKTPIHEITFENTDKVVIDANNEFAFNIFKTLPKDDNHNISPLSLLEAFTILMNGANGDTYTDLSEFLRYKNVMTEFDEQIVNHGFRVLNHKYEACTGSDKDKHVLNIANRVINNQSLVLLDGFANTVRQYYGADIQTADFRNNAEQETQKVNEWVRKQTNNKIQTIFDKIDPETTFMILNAIYFKGNWSKEFDSKLTKKLNFYNAGENVAKVDTMYKTDDYNYVESEELDSQVVELKYKGNDWSFIIILPKGRNGLKTLRKKINSQNFQQAIDGLRENNVQLFLPKFKVEKTYDLMKDINPKPLALTSRADFSRLTQSDKQVVGSAVHKTYVAVDESGTEAAAVSAGGLVMGHFHEPTPILFKTDHPFLYVIRDNTNGMILFCGQINTL